MSNIDYVLTSKGVLSVAFEGKTFTITDKEPRFKRVYILADQGAQAPLSDREAVEFRDLLNPSAKIEKAMAPARAIMQIKVVHGVVTRNGETLHSAVARRIEAFVKDGLPYTPLLNFMQRCEANPNQESVLELYDFLDRTGLPITPDGHFLAYKGVTDDFKDCHTKTFDNSAGQTHEIPREAVDPDRRQECSYGFHVGAYQYATGFGTKVMRVKVDPADAVAVPLDHNAQKLRTRKYSVLDEYDTAKGEMPSPLYGEQGETFTKTSVTVSSDKGDLRDEVTLQVVAIISEITGCEDLRLEDSMSEYSNSEHMDIEIFTLINEKFNFELVFSCGDSIQEIVDSIKAAQAPVTRVTAYLTDTAKVLANIEDFLAEEDVPGDTNINMRDALSIKFHLDVKSYPHGSKTAKVAAWYMDQLGRDDLCRYAAKRGVVKNIEEARRIGKAETAKRLAKHD